MLKNQTLKPEIILINSGSKIETNSDIQIINIDKNDFNHSNTRNLSLNFDADYFLFMTQDSKPLNNKLIEELIEPFLADDDIVISYARQIPYENAHITEVFARNKNYPETSNIKSKNDLETLGIKTFFCSNSCALYKASYFKEKNGFKRDLNFSEDMEFGARAILYDNKKIAYCSKAEVYHSHIYSISSLYKRYFFIGRFFKENSWIQNSLKSSTSTEKTGSSQAIEEILFILKKKPFEVFKSIVFTITKYLAYSIGKHS